MKTKTQLLLGMMAICFMLGAYSCKKEEVKPPTTTTPGTPRSLTAYETSVSGNWIQQRVDMYDATGTTYSSIDQTGYPASSKTHYNFTGTASTLCGNTLWQAWTGISGDLDETCWSADSVTSTVKMASVDYTIELLTTDSLIIRPAGSGAGTRIFMGK
jgi:hypothetical protein